MNVLKTDAFFAFLLNFEIFAIFPHDFKRQHRGGCRCGKRASKFSAVVNSQDLICRIQEVSGNSALFSADHQ